MKNLNAFLLCFLLTGLLALGLSSCNKSDLIENEQEEITNKLLNGKYVILPDGYEDESDAISYLNSATEAQITIMEENYRISKFLVKEGKYADAVNTLSVNENLSEINLSNYLSPRQLAQLEGFSADVELDSRGTSCFWSSGYCWTKKICCFQDGWDKYCWTVYHYNFC